MYAAIEHEKQHELFSKADKNLKCLGTHMKRADIGHSQFEEPDYLFAR